jgi:hypothetical protein
MRKHLVEEIVTSEETQTKQPACLCNCLLVKKPAGDVEDMKGLSLHFMFAITAQRRQN